MLSDRRPSAFQYFMRGLVRLAKTFILSVWRRIVCAAVITSLILIINWKIADRDDLIATLWTASWEYLKLFVWWIGLGTLSSIGLGSGMHTGILFVFPHIYTIVRSSESCNNLDFDPTMNMWGVRFEKGRNLFPCRHPAPSADFDHHVTLFRLVVKSMPYALLWGFGSVLGELPPYAASLAAARSQPDRSHYVIKEISKSNFDPETTGLRQKLMSFKHNAELAMVWFIKRHGGLGVFLLSCWPNALFDVCGIVCGSYQMPFWTFFVPLLFGKGVVKITMQTTLTVALLSKTTDIFRAHVLARAWHTPGLSWWMQRKFQSADEFERWILDWLDLLRSQKPIVSGPSISWYHRLMRRILSLDFLIKLVSLAAFGIFVVRMIREVVSAEMRRDAGSNHTDSNELENQPDPRFDTSGTETTARRRPSVVARQESSSAVINNRQLN